MFCKKCGADNKDGAAFCAKCGYSMAAADINSAVRFQTTGFNASTVNAGTVTNPNKKIYIGLGIFALIIVIFIMSKMPTKIDPKAERKKDEKAVAEIIDKYGKDICKQDWDDLEELCTEESKGAIQNIKTLYDSIDDEIFSRFGENEGIARDNSAVNDFINIVKTNLFQGYSVGDVIIEENNNYTDAEVKESDIESKTAYGKIIITTVDMSNVYDIQLEEKGLLENAESLANDLFGKSDKNIDNLLTEYFKKAKANFNREDTIESTTYLKLVKEDEKWKIEDEVFFSDDEWEKMVNKYRESDEGEK